MWDFITFKSARESCVGNIRFLGYFVDRRSEPNKTIVYATYNETISVEMLEFKIKIVLFLQ